MRSNDKLDQIFDIAPQKTTPTFTVQPYVPETTELNRDIDERNDYHKTREVLDRILVKTEAALDDMLECARSTEKGRDFEVVGQLAKTLLDATDKILEVHEKMNKLRKKEEKESQKVEIQQQNNVVFSGSPSELLEMMKKK